MDPLILASLLSVLAQGLSILSTQIDEEQRWYADHMADPDKYDDMLLPRIHMVLEEEDTP